MKEMTAEGNTGRTGRTAVFFLVAALLLLLLFWFSVNTGSLPITPRELYLGLFVRYDQNVAAVWDLRFPRILIAMLGGAALSVSGVLFQACMRNPIADPGIIGISAGAGFASALTTALFPSLYFFLPIFSFAGGIAACVLVYLLAFRNGLNPLRIILVGVAVNAVFTGLMQAFTVMSGGNLSGVAGIANAGISQKTWEDVFLLAGYAVLGLTLSWMLFYQCDLLLLSDQTAEGLGLNVTAARIAVSLVAVVLASSAAAELGVVSFLGLIVPHIARLLVGSRHKILIPFSALGGALLLLLADTIGRRIAFPHEIPAAILLSIVGGPLLILLIRRSDKSYGI